MSSKRKLIGYGFLVFAIMTTAVFLALAFSNADRILYGVKAAKIPLGRLDKKSAEAALGKKINEWRNSKIKFSYGKSTWQAAPAEFGLAIDAERTADKAYQIGRNRNAINSIADQLAAAFWGIDVKLETRFDENKLNDACDKLFSQLEKKAVDSTVAYNEKSGLFETAKEKKGVVVNRIKLRNELLASAAALSSKDIVIETVVDIPQINEAGAAPARDKANAILSRTPFTLLYQPPDGNSAKPLEFKIEKDQLKDMIVFQAAGNALRTDIDDTKLKDFLIQISPSINKKQENAVLTVKNNRVTEFSLSKNGVELDVEKSVAEIKNGILAGTSFVIALRTNVLLPEISTDTIENLGLTALLGTGESDFKGSPASRAHNIALAAKKMNGILIKPGEEFSFVNAIGEIGPKEGYQAGLVIKGNKTVPEYGGGVCQVSTTMFRAAINTGMKITERYAHSLPVQYYNPQGFDATVYGPHPDLRFVNDTPSNILVQTKIKGAKLYFEFYGTPDGREVKVTEPIEYDKKPDGSLKAKLVQEVYRDGEPVRKDTFYSVYRSPVKESAQRNPLE